MANKPIRVAMAALSERIYAGRSNKAGNGFLEPRYDVTSHVLKAIIEKVGVGYTMDVECDDGKKYEITVKESLITAEEQSQ